MGSSPMLVDSLPSHGESHQSPRLKSLYCHIFCLSARPLNRIARGKDKGRLISRVRRCSKFPLSFSFPIVVTRFYVKSYETELMLEGQVMAMILLIDGAIC